MSPDNANCSTDTCGKTRSDGNHSREGRAAAMTPALSDILLKVGLALLAIVLPLVVAKLRGFDVRDFVGLHKPQPRLFALPHEATARDRADAAR
jgi:hypothetical protein